MLWMETYLLCFSVRLGVMVISILAFLSTFIPSILFFVLGLNLLNPVLNLFNDDTHFHQHSLVKKFTEMVESDSNKLMLLFQLYFFAHMVASILAFYGTYKIKKFHLIPLTIFEFGRVLYCLAVHILLMTVCKNKFNLGVLITATLGGGFLILYLGYNWAAVVAMYQIITLINSERYRRIYGDDPFKPLIPKTYNPLVTENIRVLITPQSRDVDDQKRRNNIFNGLKANPSTQGVIAVIPSNYGTDGNIGKTKKTKWKKLQWPLASKRTQPATTEILTTATENVYNQSVDYNYWQWSELTPGFASARNKQNIYNNGMAWKY